jgi:hypothetical protein
MQRFVKFVQSSVKSHSKYIQMCFPFIYLSESTNVNHVWTDSVYLEPADTAFVRFLNEDVDFCDRTPQPQPICQDISL